MSIGCCYFLVPVRCSRFIVYYLRSILLEFVPTLEHGSVFFFERLHVMCWGARGKLVSERRVVRAFAFASFRLSADSARLRGKCPLYRLTISRFGFAFVRRSPRSAWRTTINARLSAELIRASTYSTCAAELYCAPSQLRPTTARCSASRSRPTTTSSSPPVSLAFPSARAPWHCWLVSKG